MELVLDHDKTTKRCEVYCDENGHNLYLKKSEAAALGNPKSIKVTVEPS